MKRLVIFLVFAYLFLMPCWSVAYRDSYIEMDIPNELEIQSEAWDEFIDNFRTSSDDMISYHLVLQQKGLNDFEMEAFDRYCRVIILSSL